VILVRELPWKDNAMQVALWHSGVFLGGGSFSLERSIPVIRPRLSGPRDKRALRHNWSPLVSSNLVAVTMGLVAQM